MKARKSKCDKTDEAHRPRLPYRLVTPIP